MSSAIKNKLEYEMSKICKRYNLKKVTDFYKNYPIASIDDTLDILIKSECSMCRYGDGEYKVMVGHGNGFQQSDPLLAKRLRDIIKANELDEDIMVCIPNILGEDNIRTPEAASFWKSFGASEGAQWIKMLNKSSKYYNSLATRLYMDYRDSGLSANWFSKLKKVWENKDLLIVEGEKTRLGIGNDLFSNVNSIRRIIAPSQNAFSKYDQILNTVKEIHNGELILIALGQTATVLAYDLSKEGYRALDIGHVDIEYEWFLANATQKTSVKGKYVKEVDSSPVESGEIDNEKEYRSQIVAQIL